MQEVEIYHKENIYANRKKQKIKADGIKICTTQEKSAV